MANVSFYLSRVLGNKVYSSDKRVIGRLNDIEITTDIKNPRVMAIKIKTNDGIKYIDASFLNIYEEKGQYVLTTSEAREIIKTDETFPIRKYVLDKQIIDINGRKVVRVNDIKLALLDGGIYALAVDIGMDGLLRRLGLAKPIKKALHNFNTEVSNKLLLWGEVETIVPSNDNIVLSKSYERLKTLHPSDLADILEDMDFKTAYEIFSTLENAHAADVLEEMESDSQISMLKTINVGRAADILEEMPPDEVADILDDLQEDAAEELLSNMDAKASAEVRELMEYPEESVGSLMSTDYIALRTNFTCQRAIEFLRELKPEEENIYYLYVTNNKGVLSGVVSLRDLVISRPYISIEKIMDRDFIFVYDTDSIKSLIKVVSKYNLLAVPVVNEEKVLVGMVIINDVIYELIKSKRR